LILLNSSRSPLDRIVVRMPHHCLGDRRVRTTLPSRIRGTTASRAGERVLQVSQSLFTLRHPVLAVPPNKAVQRAAHPPHTSHIGVGDGGKRAPLMAHSDWLFRSAILRR
jgi:hypothetical protein